MQHSSLLSTPALLYWHLLPAGGRAASRLVCLPGGRGSGIGALLCLQLPLPAAGAYAVLVPPAECWVHWVDSAELCARCNCFFS
jgi:hypothetical protein